MAKTYPDIGTFSPGDILTASTMNEVGTNLDNQRVPPMVRCVRTGSDTGYTVFKDIPWDGADQWDTDSMHDPSTNNTRITFNTAGIYLVQLSVNITSSGASYYDCRIKGNGTTVLVEDYRAPIGTSYAATIQTIINSATWGYVTADATVTGSVGTLNGGATDKVYFAATWLGQAS